MKKFLLTLSLMLATGSAMAAPSLTLEMQDSENQSTGATTNLYRVAIRENFTKTWAGDISLTTAQADATGALTQRIEAGAIYSPTKWFYVRSALGERFSNTGKNTFYSIEPGFRYTHGNWGARIAYRHRDAVDTNQWKTQTENTVRYAVTYRLTKNDTIGVGLDRTTNDNNSRAMLVNYTRGF